MSNQLVDLSKNDQIKANNDLAYAQLGYNFDLGVQFCHGFNLSLEADVLASAGVSTNIGEYMKAVLDIEAGIEAGIQIAAQMSPDATRDIGLILAVKAYIKAYIRARLELGLSMEAIISRVDTQVSSPVVMDVFTLFVNQIELAIGAEANAQVGFTALAEVVCKGTLVERDGQKPGFDMQVAAEAAFFYGTGVDLFGKLRFTDINGFYYGAVDIIFDHITEQAVANNPSKEDEIELAMDIAKVSVGLIIVCASKTLVEKRALSMSVFLDVLVSKLIEDFLHAYEKALKEALDELNDFIESKLDIDEEQVKLLDTLSQDVLALIEAATTAKDFADTLVVMAKIIKVMQTIQYPSVEYLTQLITYTQLIVYLSASEDDKPDFATPDAVILEEYKRVTDKTITTLDNNKAYLYLEKGDFADFLLSKLGKPGAVTKTILNVIHDSGRTLTEGLKLLFKDRSKDKASKSDNELLLFGFDVFETLLTDHVVPTINNAVKAHIDKDSIGEDYYNIVFVDTVKGLPNVLIPTLKLLLVDETKVKNPPEQPPRSDGKTPKKLTTKQKQEMIEQMLNLYLVSFLAKNINFVTQVFLEHSAQAADTNLTAAINNIRDRNFDFMAHGFIDAIEDKINELVPFDGTLNLQDDVQNELVKETRYFLLDVFRVARSALGTQTWTEQRIERLGDNIELLLTQPAGASFDFGAIDLNENKLERMEQLMTCSFIDGGIHDVLKEMVPLLGEIGAIQFKAFLMSIPARAALYFIQLVYILLLKPLAELAQAVWDAIVKAAERVQEALDYIADKLKEAGDALIELGNDLIASVNLAMELARQAILAFFQDLKNKLNKDILDWLNDIADWLLSGLSFFGVNIETAEEAITGMQQKALDNLADYQAQSLRNWVEYRSNTTPLTANEISDLLQSRIFTPALRSEVSKVKTTDDTSIDSRWRTHDDALKTELNKLAGIGVEIKDNNWVKTFYEKEQTTIEQKQRTNTRYQFFLEQLARSNIKINSPLAVDASIDQYPMHGHYVYVEIDFDFLDIRQVLKSQIPVKLSSLIEQVQKPGPNFTPPNYSEWLERSYRLEEHSPIQIYALLNGKPLPLSEFTFDGNRISAHLNQTWLKEGENQLCLMVVPPSNYEALTVKKYVNFYSSKKYRKFPSNSVYINQQKSVFNAPGNDHTRARDVDLNNKEVVVISNASDVEVDIGGWTIEDAYGHKYTFVSKRIIRPKQDYRLFIGKVPGRKYNWVAEYNGRVIALLNNKGEFLKLTDTKGKVVSHIYTGSPSTNKHITFLSQGGN